jgi:hypothetical protein
MESRKNRRAGYWNCRREETLSLEPLYIEKAVFIGKVNGEGTGNAGVGYKWPQNLGGKSDAATIDTARAHIPGSTRVETLIFVRWNVQIDYH